MINHDQLFLMNNFGSFMYCKHDILFIVAQIEKIVNTDLFDWIMRIFSNKTTIAVLCTLLLGSTRSN